MFPTKKVWYIHCMTGCSCCSYENFYQGFYEDKQEACQIIDQYNKGIGNPLCSQYAKYGRYCLEEAEAELLPDGRVIVESSVYSSLYGNTWPE